MNINTKTLKTLQVNHNTCTVRAIFEDCEVMIPYAKLSEIDDLMGSYYNLKYNENHNKLYFKFLAL